MSIPPTLRPRRIWLGAAVVIAIVLAVSYLDRPIAYWAHGLDPTILELGGLFTRLGNSAWYLIPLGVAVPALFIAGRRTQDPRRAAMLRWMLQAAIFLFLAIALSGLLADLLKIVFGRARPVLLFRDGYAGWQPFTLQYKLHSFPSGHANTVTALAVALIFLRPRWLWPLLTLAALVSLTRIMIGQHYLSDVIAGCALAVVTTLWLRSAFARRGWLFMRKTDGNTVVRRFAD